MEPENQIHAVNSIAAGTTYGVGMNMYIARLLYLGSDTKIMQSVLDSLLGKFVKQTDGIITQAWLEDGWVTIMVHTEEINNG